MVPVKPPPFVMCTGLLLPDKGAISINGHNVLTNGPDSRSSMAYVPDEPYLYERLSAREFLSFMGRIYGLEGRALRSTLDDVVARFHLTDFA